LQITARNTDPVESQFIHPSLKMRGWGRFFKKIPFNPPFSKGGIFGETLKYMKRYVFSKLGRRI
jgi:hypothetical protein